MYSDFFSVQKMVPRILCLTAILFLFCAGSAWGQWKGSEDIYTSGFVGIGTSSAPDRPLHLEATTPVIKYTETESWLDWYSGVNGAGSHWGVWHGSTAGENKLLSLAKSGDLQLNGDLRLDDARYNRLHIVSDDYWAGVEIRTREVNEGGNPHIDFTHGQGANYGLRLYAPTNNRLQIEGGHLRVSNPGEGNTLLQFDTERDWAFEQVNTDAYTALRLRSIGGGGNKHFFIDTDGGVGIGTTTQTTKGYKLAVGGDMSAHEVVVDEENWPDYVFRPSYDLPSLDDVARFIDQNAHLPSVPSAETVEKNGLHLGEMDATLLRKMEELTLYAIEQKERADSLSARLRQQRRRNDEQQNQIEVLRTRLDQLEQRLQSASSESR